MKQLLFIIPLLFIISCDYAKQQSELTELKLKNIDLQKQVNRYKTDSLFKSSMEEKNPHRLKATRMIDSLRFKDPETLKHIEIEIENNRIEFER